MGTTDSFSDAAAGDETVRYAAVPEVSAAADSPCQEGCTKPTSEEWGFSEFDLLLPQPSDATHIVARAVSEDPMMEEVAASLVVCLTAACDHLAQTAAGSALRSPEDDDAQVAQPQVPQIAPPGAAATPMEDEDDGPPGFCLPAATVEACTFSTPPREGQDTDDVGDSTASRRLKSFTKRVLRKRESPLIREPPKLSPAKPVRPWRSRRLAAQGLSRVPASKRGEVLIMQRFGYTKGPSAPSASEVETFDKLFNGDMTGSEAEAFDALLPAVAKGSSKPRKRKATS